MSESTDLVRRVGFTIRQASVIPMPIDPTLKNEGEAADAKATGDAITGALNRLKVNNKSVAESGDYKVVILYASDIKVSSDEGAQTIAEALTSASSTTADDIVYDPDNLISVKDAIDGINETLDTELSEDEIDSIFEEVFEEEADE